MSKILFILVMIMGLAVFGCGEQPDQSADTAADSGDAGVDADSHESGSGDTEDSGDRTEARVVDEDSSDRRGDRTAVAGTFDLSTPELSVGQWIEFGADDLRETVTISVVGTEVNQGDECLWVQLSGPDFVAQILMDPSGLDIAMEGYQEQMDVFFADPAAYIRDNMADAEGMAGMMSNEDGMEMALEFVKAIRMVKFDQGGMAMAIDMTGVPEFLEEMMSDPSFQDTFQEGFMQGFNEEQGQEGLDEIMTELDNMDFAFEAASVEAGGSQVEGIEFSLNHPDVEVTVVFSSELPIIPLAYASFFSAEDNESHTVEVRGFGFSGAENLMPGEPAQVIPAMMFLQGMTQQMGAQEGRSAGIR